MNKLEFFKDELGCIKNKDAREFAEAQINGLPDYFFEIPASSTSKYHPTFALGEGGLVRHTKSAVRIAVELFGNQTTSSWMSEKDKDSVVIALLLHDGCKNGVPKSKYTITEHPLVVVEHIKSNKVACDLIDEKQLEDICNGISTHMGEWSKDYKTNKEVLPKPKARLERFIHMCDYLASRKCLEHNFDAKVSR